MNKYEILLKQDKKTLHAADLALMWNISNKNTLNMTLKRFVDRKILTRIHKGFYALKDIETIDKFDLGHSYLNTYSYLSLETILAREGIIFQDVQYITFVSNKSTVFCINDVHYRSRQLKDSFLFNTAGVTKVQNHFEASVERAIADMLYYNPKYHFDNINGIDYDKVRKLQMEIGYVNS